MPWGRASAAGRLGRTVYYTYYAMGHVAHITVKDVGYPTYKDLCLHYADNETLWYAMWQEWDEQYGQTHYDWPACPDEDDPNHLTVPDAWEFRFDSGRERYLARQWDTQGSNWQPYWTELGATWTDYLGDEPWGDYGVTLDANDTPEVTEQTRFLGGLGIQAQETVAQPPSAVLFHGDLTGSTMLLTDEEGGVAGSPTSYTAFGEQVWRDPNSAAHVGGPLPAGYPRFAYAGAYGYESGPWGQDPNEAASPGPLVLYGANPDLPPITLLHVGARWYQPGIGRFVQRDPDGIRGGLNVYLYCLARPLVGVDPTGLAAWYDVVIWLTGGNKSWLDNNKTVDTATTCALCVAGVATAGVAVGVAGPLIVPAAGAVIRGCRPPPPGPSWDWWDEWENDPQFWL